MKCYIYLITFTNSELYNFQKKNFKLKSNKNLFENRKKEQLVAPSHALTGQLDS